MKKKSASRSAFFNPRFLISFGLCAAGVLLALGVGWSAPEDRTPVKSRFEGYTGLTTAMPVNSSRLAPNNQTPSQPQTEVVSRPDVVFATLYDQYDNAATTASVSQNFEPANDTFDAQLGDDFVVPAGQTWTINEVDASGLYFNGAGPADSFNVFFYTNSGTLPAVAAVYTATNQAYTNTTGNFVIPLTVPAVLSAGTYWVSVQANMTFSVGGEWGWTDRTIQSNSPAALRNPGGGFACSGGTGWIVKTSCNPTAGGPDQVFRILGSVGGGASPTPTPTATPPPATPSPTATPSGSCTPGGNPGPWATAAPAPPARYRSGGVTDGTNIYVFGGGNATTQLN